MEVSILVNNYVTGFSFLVPRRGRLFTQR
jgi:hypothetical protein